MDDKLLGRAVEHHGPDFLRQLQLEQQTMPPNIFLHLQRHRPHPPEIDDPQFILNVRRFISKKADMLFQPVTKKNKNTNNPVEDNEDCFAKMPPLETFMGIDPNTCRRHFFISLQARDLVIGIVTSILDSGLVLQFLCMDDDKNRDIDALRITAFVPVKEIPKMFPTQNPTEGYQVQDFIRGVVVSVNIETETILVSLSDKELGDREGEALPHLGLIHEEDFPVQYRRKLHIRGLTFDELLNSIMGFTNPGNVQYILRSLGQAEDTSMMRGLHRLKISEKEYADGLRKQQSQKMAYKNVAQGIAFFKEGRQTEAMQQLNKALQIDAKNVEALVARGALYANNESYTRAIQDFEEALQLNRKHPNAIKYMHETLLAKGKGHEDGGDWDDAEDCYKKALILQPDSHEAKESIRYVQYRKESSKSKSKPEKKSYIEKSESPVYQSTTDTLKKMIEGHQTSRKKKTASGEKKEKRRRSRKYSSSSSSSSSSGSSSRSRSDSRSRSRSPRPKSVRKSGSPSQNQSRVYKEDRRLSGDPDLRYQKEQYTASQHYSFFKKDERIPFLESSPPKVDGKHSDELYKPEKPMDDEDDELYGDSKYAKPEPRRMPSGGQKPISRADHSSYQIGRKKSPHRRDVKGDLKLEVKERSVTPTKDEINDRLGLEDISPDIHEDRRTDDAKYRSGHDSKAGKRTLHISKQWSPDGKKRDATKSRHSRERHQSSDRHSPSRIDDKKTSDRSKDYYDRGTSDRYDDQDTFEKQDSFEERRIISVGKRGTQDMSKYKNGDDYKVLPGGGRSSDRSLMPEEEEHHERRSIMISKKTKQMDTSERKEMEYISHVISVQPKERRKRRSTSYRSRSRSRSRMRSRSRSRSRRRSRSRSRGRSRSGSRESSRSRSRSVKKKYDKISPKRFTESDRRSRERESRSYERDDRSSSKRRNSKEVNYGKRSYESSKGHHSPEYRRKEEGNQISKRGQPSDREMLIMRGVKVNQKYERFSKKQSSNDEREGKDFPVRDSKMEKKPIQPSMSDIFADLPPPVASKSSLSMAFATYVPRAVKLKQYQPPEVSLNPESRPPPPSVQPNVPQNRDQHVTEIKDRVFSLYKTKTTESVYERENVDNKFQSRSSDDKMKDYERSGSPDEKRYEKLHKYRRHSRSSSGSRSPVARSKGKKIEPEYRRSRSHSRGRSPDQKFAKRSQKYNNKTRSSSTSKDMKRKRHKAIKLVAGRNVFPTTGRTKRRSESQSPDRYKKKSDMDSHSRKYSRSRSRSYDRERKSSRSKEISGKDIEIRRTIQVADAPALRSKWDSPEEKQTRWEETMSSSKTLQMPLMISNLLEGYAGVEGSQLISKSPPPHRRMKPEEEKKLKEKWKEMELQDEKVEVQPDYVAPENIKLSKMFESKVREIEDQIMGTSSGKKADDFGRVSKENVSKKTKETKVRSKWDSDSDSSSGSRRNRRRSSLSRSRSRDRDSQRKSSSGKRLPHSKNESLPDVVKSAKKDDKKVFWFHREKIEGEGKNKDKKQKSKKARSKSPKRKRSRSPQIPLSQKSDKEETNKNPFNKAKSPHDKTTPKKAQSLGNQYDSLQAMEKFLKKLKTDKKINDQRPSTIKK